MKMMMMMMMMMQTVGMTPLNMACNRRNTAIARIFITANAFVNLADATGNLPLHYIARCGDVDVARLLLENGTYTYSATDYQRPTFFSHRVALQNYRYADGISLPSYVLFVYCVSLLVF